MPWINEKPLLQDCEELTSFDLYDCMSITETLKSVTW